MLWQMRYDISPVYIYYSDRSNQRPSSQCQLSSIRCIVFNPLVINHDDASRMKLHLIFLHFYLSPIARGHILLEACWLTDRRRPGQARPASEPTQAVWSSRHFWLRLIEAVNTLWSVTITDSPLTHIQCLLAMVKVTTMYVQFELRRFRIERGSEGKRESGN